MADLARVWATSDPFEGEMMRGRLEAEGLQVLMKGDGEGPYRAGPVYLFVPVEQEADARTIVDAVTSGAFERDLDEAADDERGSDD